MTQPSERVCICGCPIEKHCYEDGTIKGDCSDCVCKSFVSIADGIAAEHEACALAVERAYLACTEPGVFNRHVWQSIVEQAKAEIAERARMGEK